MPTHRKEVLQCSAVVGLQFARIDLGERGVIPEQENLRSESCINIVRQKSLGNVTFTSYLKTLDICRVAI